MNWANVWKSIFGTTTWFDIDIGFWVSTFIALLIALIMVIVFWSLKPLTKEDIERKKENSKNKKWYNLFRTK